MYKLFTVTEASEMIPVVDGHLRDMQGAIKDLLAAQQSFAKAKPLSIKARNLYEEISFLLRSIEGSKAELDRLGVYLKNVDAGVVDFPSRLGAEVVYLSWRQGEPAITHYHRLTADATQQPLPLN
ncbi:MAG: DUF2203 domain-containing protein [Deinococcota bacterium]|jgi:hypothetical protein|nr:DUF2203 domain-containing protein [Deinococcota bacterium]